MGWKMTIKKSIAELYSINRLIIGPRHGLRIFIYHSVSKGVIDDPDRVFTVNPKLFAIHMKTLVEDETIELVELSQGLKAIDNNKLKVAVTFDDGYKDALYTVTPIMEKYQIPFTVFVSTSFIQNGDVDYMTPSDLIELSRIPEVTIGSHGVTHRPLTNLDDKSLKTELILSKEYIENLIGMEVASFSYPHGAVDKRVRDAVENSGYKCGVTSYAGISNSAFDRYLISRTSIISSDSKRVFRQKCHGVWDWYRWIRKDSRIIRKLLYQS